VLAAPIHNKFQAIHPVLASVYYESVVRRPRVTTWKLEIPIILGCVIAHELGHLLLGSNGHSDRGIMQSQWEPRQVKQLLTGSLLFTTEQSKQNARGGTNANQTSEPGIRVFYSIGLMVRDHLTGACKRPGL
jgi:hypothetical protein